MVVAPSLVPRKPGDHVKTNRRDAVALAKFLRADELTAVWVPDEGHEAMRDLVRARSAAVESLRVHRQQVSAFMLKHGRIYPRKTSWTVRYLRWLQDQRFEHPAHQIALQEMVEAVGIANPIATDAVSGEISRRIHPGSGFARLRQQYLIGRRTYRRPFVSQDHDAMPNRFSRLIALCGFTQQEAADYLGLAHKTVSMKSAGMRKIADQEEERLASLWALISDLDQQLPEDLPRGGQERRQAISEAFILNGQR